VGSFPPNPWGLHDMHGNVWEWCADWSAPYTSGEQLDPFVSAKRVNDWHVLRGGSWCNHPEYCRTPCRYFGVPAPRNNCVGFRIAFTLE
jgi:formylglycine-generating enzyme required for sulfatase activity